jgi:predicted DNA-binding protein
MALKTISFRIEEFDRARLEKIAAERGKPATTIVREVLQRYIDNFEESERKAK